MKQVDKFTILALADEARNKYYTHRKFCEEIEVLLSEHTDTEILDVLYQPSDGIIVEIPNEPANDNIPIKQFLNEYCKKETK